MILTFCRHVLAIVEIRFIAKSDMVLPTSKDHYMHVRRIMIVFFTNALQRQYSPVYAILARKINFLLDRCLLA